MWRIMRSRLGEFFSLSSLVQTLPTSSDGLTALRRRRSFSQTYQPQLSPAPFSGPLTCRALIPAASAGGQSLSGGGS